MRRLVLQMSVSLDGFVARPDGAHEWGYQAEDEACLRWKLDSVRTAGAHLMGRVTYQDMAAVWPTSSNPVAAPMNDIPKVVFSKTLKTADWTETRIASGDVSEEVAKIKREPGNDVIAHGGAAFARTLSRLGLIDECRLLIQPAALGTGMPLFTELQSPLFLELAEAHRFDTGAAVHVYRPRGA